MITCSMRVSISGIYENTYKDTAGIEKTSYNLEFYNADFNSKYDRHIAIPIDKACWDRLDLSDKGKSYERKEGNIVCQVRPYKIGFGLVVLDIQL